MQIHFRLAQHRGRLLRGHRVDVEPRPPLEARHPIPRCPCVFSNDFQDFSTRPTIGRIGSNSTDEVVFRRILSPILSPDNARCVKIARLMGYEKIITYTLESEGGASLRALGARPIGPLFSHEWTNVARPRKSQSVYQQPKYRLEL
jgi:hypothetical protein